MKKMFLDDALREQLCDTTAPLQLCDLTGRVVGYFSPVGLAAADAETIQRLELPEELAEFLEDSVCQPFAGLFEEAEQPATA